MPKNKERLFSDDEAMAYIAALENPGKVGWDPAKKVWRTPKGKGYDNNQIAYGLDTRLEHNPIVYNYLKDKGRLNDPWLTDKEARNLAMQTYRQKKDSVAKAIEIAKGNVSLRGYNILSGMAWHGHPMKSVLSPDSITGKAFRKAIKQGDQDFDSVFDAYYHYGTNEKQFAERILADKSFRPKANAKTYVMADGTKKMVFEKPDWAKSKVEIPNPYMPHREPPTEYPIDTAKRNPNKYLDPWNGAGSPSYGGYAPRLQDIQEVNSRINHDILNMIGIDPTINKFLIPFAPKYNKGKNATARTLPRFDEGTPTTVGPYNIYPSAVVEAQKGDKALLNATWNGPDIPIFGTDRRPLYQRYDAYGSTYDPNAIRSITDWVPGIGDVSLGFDAVNAFKNQDYLQAGMLGALMFAPNALEPITKPILKAASKFKSSITNLVKGASSPVYGNGSYSALSRRWEPDELKTLSKNNPVRDLYGTNYDQYPEEIKNSIYNSVYNRMNSLRNDPEFAKDFAGAFTEKYTTYSGEPFKKAYGGDFYGGMYFDNTDHIAIRDGNTDYALGHETVHQLDSKLGRIPKEKAFLEDAFDSDFLKGATELERSTTNYDSRKAFLGKMIDSKSSVKTLNKIIDAATDDEVFSAVENANEYGKRYIAEKRKAKKLDHLLAKRIKESWKNVGAAAAPMIPTGAALYMGAKDFKQEDWNNAVNNLKVLAEGVGYNKGKDLPKYGMGEDIINAAVDFGKGVTPIYGTYLDAKEFYNNPSPETLGYLALSALSDGLLLSGAGSFLGMGLKSLRGARAASSAAKALSVTPGKHLARYSAKTAEAARLKKKAAQQLTKGVGVDIAPQSIQTYKKYAE